MQRNSLLSNLLIFQRGWRIFEFQSDDVYLLWSPEEEFVAAIAPERALGIINKLKVSSGNFIAHSVWAPISFDECVRNSIIAFFFSCWGV